MSTCNQLDLETLRSRLDMPGSLPKHCNQIRHIYLIVVHPTRRKGCMYEHGIGRGGVLCYECERERIGDKPSGEVETTTTTTKGHDPVRGVSVWIECL